MFIQTEATPNPATLKFLPGKVVMPEGTFDARDARGAAASPLAQRLFEVPGVAGVFFGHDFVTVTKGEGEWQHMKPAILGAMDPGSSRSLSLGRPKAGPEGFGRDDPAV